MICIHSSNPQTILGGRNFSYFCSTNKDWDRKSLSNIPKIAQLANDGTVIRNKASHKSIAYLVTGFHMFPTGLPTAPTQAVPKSKSAKQMRTLQSINIWRLMEDFELKARMFFGRVSVQRIEKTLIIFKIKSDDINWVWTKRTISVLSPEFHFSFTWLVLFSLCPMFP
jgi:hypothetical protein